MPEKRITPAEDENTDIDNQEDQEENLDDSQEDNSENDGEDSDDDGEDKDDDDDPTPEDLDEEPPVKKSVKDFIIERKNQKIEKLKNKIASKEKDKNLDDEINPEDEKIVSKVVEEKFGKELATLKAHNQKAQERADQEALDTLLKNEPEYEPYRTKIEKWSKAEGYKHLPIEVVAVAACAKHLKKIGAKQEKRLAKEANDSRSGGGTTRTNEPKDYESMSDEEFEKEKHKVRTG